MLPLAVFATKTSVSLLFSSKMLNTASEKNYPYPSQSHVVFWKFVSNAAMQVTVETTQLACTYLLTN